MKNVKLYKVFMFKPLALTVVLSLSPSIVLAEDDILNSQINSVITDKTVDFYSKYRFKYIDIFKKFYKNRWERKINRLKRKYERSNNNNQERRVIKSFVATGFNDILGHAPFNLGHPFDTFGFTSMGVYNYSDDNPIPLSTDNQAGDLVATAVDPGFLGLAGKTRDDVKPEWENIPLRDTPVNTDFAFELTDTLKGELETMPGAVSQAEPVGDITIGSWMKARGTAIIKCESSDKATLKIKAKNLVPNRMYGVWATLGGEFLSSFPIGGTPNMFVTDYYGNGEIERVVKFCPLDPESADRPVLVINVVYYSRHQNYGAVPEPVFVDGLWLGTVTHNHLQFPVNIESINYE